jgi:hypothetical protein
MKIRFMTKASNRLLPEACSTGIGRGASTSLLEVLLPLIILLLLTATAFGQAKPPKSEHKGSSKFNASLAKTLDSIYDEDQRYRRQMGEVAAKHGWESKEMQELWRVAGKVDAANLEKVERILEKHGWLGPETVGEKGNSALFLVIQHADSKTQNKYLPIMQAAYEKGNAKGSQLALLIDRVALSNGQKQVYGSQVAQDPKTNKYKLSAMEDPDHVDERRAKMGLGPLAEYLKQWGIVWDVEAFKKTMTK